MPSRVVKRLCHGCPRFSHRRTRPLILDLRPRNALLPAGQEFLMAPRRLLARPGQVEKLLTLDGVLGLFGELSIFLRLAAKVVDVLHTMVSHLSGARVATQPTRRSMTRKHE